MSGQPDIPRLVGDLIRFGRIASVDLASHTCRVALGDIVTGDVPWLAGRAGDVSIWSPPVVGEQCLFLAPEGDAEAGVVLLGLFSNANPPAGTDAGKTILQFADGASISYDQQAHALEAILPGGGTAKLIAPGGLTIKSDITINGKIDHTGDYTLTGKLDASDDVIAGGKSLKSHKHGNVAAGGAQTGTPL